MPRGSVAGKISKLLVDMLSQERGEGRHTGSQLTDGRVKGLVGSVLVVCHLFAPESRAVQTDVPVGEILDKFKECRDYVVELVFNHFPGHVGFERLQSRQNPLVGDVFRFNVVRVCFPVIDAGISGKELEGVVPGQ